MGNRNRPDLEPCPLSQTCTAQSKGAHSSYHIRDRFWVNLQVVRAQKTTCGWIEHVQSAAREESQDGIQGFRPDVR